MGKLYSLVIIAFLLMPRSPLAQSLDCEQTITLATEEFNAGHFYSVPGILKECLNAFSRDQKQRAYLLLTQTYLLLDDPIGAEISFLEVLSANPEFVADEQLHPIDVVYLSKRFTAIPKFSWFVGAGTNVSPVRVILDRQVTHESEKYTLLPGYHFGVGGEYSYNDRLRLRLELNYLHTAYRGQADERFGNDSKIVRDRQSWINVPAYVSYTDHTGAYRPYVYVGYSVSRLFSDKASITLEKVTEVESGSEEGEAETFTDESADYDFRLRRNAFHHAIIFGGGVKYKIGLDFVFIELRYSAGLRNVVRPDGAYGNHALDQTSPRWVESISPVAEYGHIDDYFRLDNLAVSVGFVRPLYKPRALKRARTKGVLRKMNQSR